MALVLVSAILVFLFLHHRASFGFLSLARKQFDGLFLLHHTTFSFHRLLAFLLPYVDGSVVLVMRRHFPTGTRRLLLHHHTESTVAASGIIVVIG